MPSEKQTSSDAVADEDYTISPTSSVRDRELALDTKANPAPQIREEESEQEKEEYAGSAAALLDKYIFSGKGIPFPFVVVLVIMGWIFVQDNEAGKLEDWKSILWTVQKCLFFLVLYFAFLIYRWAKNK